MTADPDRPRARAPRGFEDRRGKSVRLELTILEAVSRVYESYGFELLESGAFEYADAIGRFLPDADRPNDGVFALRDDDGQWMALRYDLTAPLARYVAEHRDGLARPFRRYAFGPVWRNEKPGPGRYRQFLQCDADTVGSARAEADAEIIAMAIDGYAAAGLDRRDFVLKINSRRLLDGLLSSTGVTDLRQRLAALRAIDKLDRLGAAGVTDLLGAGRRDESGAFTKGAELRASATEAVLAFLECGAQTRGASLSRLSDAIGGSKEGDEGLAELAAIDQALSGLGVDSRQAVFAPAVVRGLEYYTGAVFEAEFVPSTASATAEPQGFGAIGGGGRYDDLVARFTGESVPATGFSFGVSRLAAALEVTGYARQDGARGPVVVVAFESSRMADYFGLACEIRAAGIAAEVYLGGAGLRAQLKYADRRLSPAAVILGDDEIAAGSVTIKDLDLGRALAEGVGDNRAWREGRPGQVTVPRPDLVAVVRRIVEDRP
jgi:histidyl-tRNA synthetase